MKLKVLIPFAFLVFMFAYCDGETDIELKGNIYVIKDTDTPYTGMCVEFKEGQKAYEGKVVDGKKQGKWTWWYQSGKKRWERNFEKGELHGKIKAWTKDGDLKYEKTYNMGELVD